MLGERERGEKVIFNIKQSLCAIVFVHSPAIVSSSVSDTASQHFFPFHTDISHCRNSIWFIVYISSFLCCPYEKQSRAHAHTRALAEQDTKQTP